MNRIVVVTALIVIMALSVSAQTAQLQVSGNPVPGGMVFFSLFAPLSAGLNYVLALSFGNTPGIMLPDRRIIPLNLDQLLLLSLQAPQAIGLFNSVGVIPPFGSATAFMQLPHIPELNGLTVYAAFVTIDPRAPSGIRDISNSARFAIAAGEPVLGPSRIYGCSPVPVIRFSTPHFATMVLNLTGVGQFNQTHWGNNSCAPSSGASIVEFLNRTRFRGIMNGSLVSQVDELRAQFGTNNDGTDPPEVVRGWIRFLRKRNLQSNFTVSWYFFNITVGGNPIIGQQRNVTISGTNVSLYGRNATAGDIITEMRRGELMIGFYVHKQLGWSHAMAIDNVNDRPNANGNFNVSFMDPAVGGIIETEMTPRGSIDIDNGVANLIHLVALSPR